MDNAFPLHQAAKLGNRELVAALLRHYGVEARSRVNELDRKGLTPLMHALQSTAAGVDLVEALLAAGADIEQECTGIWLKHRNAITIALAAGDPGKVSALINAGADIRYTRQHDYNALLDAVHGRDIFPDSRLIELLNLLIAHAVDLDKVSTYAESGLRVLSRLGRFDAVKVLLDAGAPAAQLEWSPLQHAIALGTAQDVAAAIADGTDIEQRDYWERTAWLLALQTGDLTKAQMLQAAGADVRARGRCGQSPLLYAIESHHAEMLTWLMTIDTDLQSPDEFRQVPHVAAVHAAAECGNLDALNILIAAGGDIDAEGSSGTALHNTSNPEVVRYLLSAGADQANLSYQGIRSLLRLDPVPDSNALQVSQKDFEQGRCRRFGTSNPESINDPFWLGMIRSGITGWEASRLFAQEDSRFNAPVWCAQRFGQSITLLPDGRIIQVGGEHEDSYDPDFCIFNDVFVHHPDGSIDIYAYPEDVFPPTDFHTATLVGETIILIGSLGYHGKRHPGVTPVYALNTRTLHIDALATHGDMPGWISRHRATAIDSHLLKVSGGKLIVQGKRRDETDYVANHKTHVLDLRSRVWREI